MKKLIGFIILFTMIMIPNYSMASNNINLMIDGVGVKFTEQYSQPYVDETNRTQIPVRAAVEAFGAEAEWISATKTVVVKYMETTVELPVGNKYLIVNGNKISMDTEVRINNGRTYLPIRPVFVALGAKVSWDEKTNTIIVDKTGITNKFEDEIKESGIISYENFRDMFQYEGTALTGGTDTVWIMATYSGNLSESAFKELWKSIPDKHKEYYMKKIAVEKQGKNPKYDAIINFVYGRNGVFVQYSLGRSSCNINGNASASPENPFDEVKLNPLN